MPYNYALQGKSAIFPEKSEFDNIGLRVYNEENISYGEKYAEYY